MTIKGKRDGALRKMDHSEAERLRMSGLLDTRFPEKPVHALLARHGIDASGFDDFFGHALGLFRMFRDSRKSAPTVGEERKLVDEAMACVDQLRTRMDALPPYATALIDEVCLERHGELFFAPAQRLGAELDEVWRLLALTQEKLQPQKKAGRTSESSRDALLCDVAHWLQERGMAKMDAAGVAAEILRECDVDAPEDPRKARDLVRDVEKFRSA